MDLFFNMSLADGYKSAAQRARILTENWVAGNMFCPRCGNVTINHMKNNSPVGDFKCPQCNSQYELKSKSGLYKDKANDGAYETMIQRITSSTNPDFFFMSYLPAQGKVKDLFLVPKHFFVPNIIEKRKPLADTARRAGWVGCNILLNQIPQQGRINIITNGTVHDSKYIIDKTNHVQLLETKDISARGWLMDTLLCLNAIKATEFTLSDVYTFIPVLAEKHPNNNNVQAKIRQQLQMLRDKGFVEFLGNGKYRKCGD